MVGGGGGEGGQKSQVSNLVFLRPVNPDIPKGGERGKTTETVYIY